MRTPFDCRKPAPCTLAACWVAAVAVAAAHGCSDPVPPGGGQPLVDGFFFGGEVAPAGDGGGLHESGCLGATGQSCASVADCDDGLDCTTDLCDPCNGKCSHDIAAGKCLIGGKCWAADTGPLPCIRCVPETSQTGLTPTPTAVCDDGDPCTPETVCDEAGQCVGKALAGCCQQATDCDDADPCTADDCQAQVCTHNPLPDCCSAGACCGPATGKVLPAGTVCGQDVLAIQYQCEGAKIQRRVAHPSCDGLSADGCNKQPAKAAWAAWEDVETCPSGKKCLLVASDLQPTCSSGNAGGTCSAHADCDDYLPCHLSFCDAGKCGNFPKEAGTQCATKEIATEYGCDGYGDGSDVMVRVGHPACDGAGGVCDPYNGLFAWSAWKLHQPCPSGTSCHVADTATPGTCVKGPPPNKCTPGATCCPNGQYAAKGTKCGSSQMKKEYFCSGSGNGSDVMLKFAYAGCTGSSTSCSSSSTYLFWVTETYKNCSSFQKCEVKYPTSSGTCVAGDKCTPGTTCCPDGQYAAKGTKCATSVYKKQYSCSGAGPGNTILVQEAFKGCVGTSTTCSSSSSYLSWGPIKTYKKCSSSTSCSVTSSGTSATCKS